MAMVRVYATTYRAGDPADNKTHDLGWLPVAPRVGETMHYSTTGNEDDSIAWHVSAVSWSQGSEHFGAVGFWHLEITLGCHH